MIAQSDPVC